MLVLTGDVTIEQQQAALAAGAAAFLSKPMARERLQQEVARLGLQPRGEGADGADGADGAAADLPATQQPAADAAPELIPNLHQLDELLLSVAINELDWGRAQIGALAVAGDAARLAQAAHRIKGTARELRCELLVAAALALEQACKRDPQAGQGAWPAQALLDAVAQVHAVLAPRLEAVTQR